MSSPRRKRQTNKSSTAHIPDSSEIRHIIDQYIDEQSNRDITTRSGPIGIDSIGDIQTYIMEKNPSWSVPEKRRLQKFVKRAISHRSPEPSTPSSQQSELTSDSTNNEFDNQSERSRSSRLKGITNRLFGGGSPKKSKSQVPVREIQTTTKTLSNNAEELFTDPVLLNSGITTEESNQESIKNEHAGTNTPIIPEIKDDLPVVNDSAQPVVVSRDVVDGVYSDENDGKIAKGERCCFLCFC